MGIGHTYTWRHTLSLNQTTANLNELAVDQHFCANSSESSRALALDLGRQNDHTFEDDPVSGLIDRENQVADWNNSDNKVISFESKSESEPESLALVEEREELDDETYIEMTMMYGWHRELDKTTQAWIGKMPT